ncbi:hypothetical protein [Haloarcula onubensis]|uniref:DUF8151 domain-containing protein n=1 Tax=Haloarcula onubensis TaxID=2950539 RepID=A0ABU2FQX9_9EURY|nr:hypothetical protein [Halomicroarcula sp. S3CR25-11]MDS0282692.1 hypothetical protein [Halomicroarcula sp. S3CR25-11]
MSASESVVVVPDLLVSLVFAPLLTVVGGVTEQAALATLSGGVSTFGLWELYMGLLLLYAGVYMIGFGKLLPALGSRIGTGPS